MHHRMQLAGFMHLFTTVLKNGATNQSVIGCSATLRRGEAADQEACSACKALHILQVCYICEQQQAPEELGVGPQRLPAV